MWEVCQDSNTVQQYCNTVSSTTSALSTFNTTIEVRPLSKAPNPQLLPRAPQYWLPTAPGVYSRCVCVHCYVRALGWVKCRAQIQSMGHHTWPHVTSLHCIVVSQKRRKCVQFNKCIWDVKSSHLYLYSPFNNTNCVKATAQYQIRIFF